MARNTIMFVATSLFLGLVAAFLVTKGLPRTSRSQLGARSKETSFDDSVPEAARILLAQLDHLHGQEKSRDVASKTFALYRSIGQIYQDFGDFLEALKFHTRARDLAVQEGESEQIVDAQTMLGIVYGKAGRRQEAQKELEGAFLLLNRRGPNAFATLRALGNVRRDSGKFEEALALYAQAQEPQEPQWNSPMHMASPSISADGIAGLLLDKGIAHHSRGKLDEAMDLYKQSLDKQVAVGGNVGRQTGTVLELVETYNQMGRCFHDKGDVERAEEYYFKALRLQQKSFRRNHPSIVATLMNIAQAQRDSGSDLEVPLATLDRAEAMLKGAESVAEYSRVLSLKADVLREKGQLEEAEAHALQALAAQRSILGSDEMPETAIILNGLGSVLHDRGKIQEAVDQYMDALNIHLSTLGTEHPETAATYNNIGNAFQDIGQNEEAVRYYTQCLEIQRKVFGEMNPDLAVSYNNIGTVLVRQEKFAEADSYVVKAIELLKASGVPPTSPERAIFEENLAMIRERLAAPGATSKATAA